MNPSDKALILEIQSGKTGSFRTLVERHRDRAFTLAMRLLQRRHEAEEALQDAFLRAFQALGEFRGDAKFSTWFYRIVYNVCLTRLDRRKPDGLKYSLQEDEEERAPLQLPSDDPLPDGLLEQEEFVTVVSGEIARLPEQYRRILVLYYLEEFSYEEMSDMLQLPLGTIKTHLHRGRALLRSAVIGKYYPEVKTQ